MTEKLTIRERFGYAAGDFGMQFVFGLVSSVLQKYYTDVLRIPTALIMVLFIVARIWDAVNDPMWGAYVDSRPVHEEGRYRRWIRVVSLPLALAAILMFVKIPGLSTTGYFIYACITYTAFGMIYTGMNVPYGSMASVMTNDDHERSILSVFRAVGSTLGTVPAMVLIMLCYVKVDGVRTMSYSRILIGATGIALLSAVFTRCCYRMTKEHLYSAPKAKQDRGELNRTLRTIFKSRPFLILSISAMLFLSASVFSQSYYAYLADKYFGMPSMQMLAMVCQYLPVAAVMFFIGKWVKRFGRKTLCAAGMLSAGVCSLILYFLQTHNIWVFLGMCLLSGIGISFIYLQIWALAAEVIDWNKYKFGVTNEATSYSLFSFIRKLGHAVSAIFINASLMKIGYSVDNLTDEALHGMYNSSVLIPAILYLTVFVLLQFFYPIGKKEMAELQAEAAGK